MGAEQKGEGQVARALQTVLRAKRVWSADDNVPSELEQLLASAGENGVVEVLSAAQASLEGARLAALLVIRHPSWLWPSRELALAIARRLGKDRPEQETARYDAILLLTKREPGVVEYLLRELVLGVPENAMETVLVADLCERQRECPDVFLEALKRVAGVQGQRLVMSGLIFRGFCELPPSADGEMRAAIVRACERFHDPAWIGRGDEQRLLELFGDVLSLAGVLLDRDVFGSALECICELLSQRPWSRTVAPGLVTPLVMWKDQVEEVAPWLEGEYEARLSPREQATWGGEATELIRRIRSGHYRRLKRNPAIERRQAWREWAAERARAHR